MFFNIGGTTSELILLITSFDKRLVRIKLHMRGTYYNWIWVWIIQTSWLHAACVIAVLRWRHFFFLLIFSWYHVNQELHHNLSRRTESRHICTVFMQIRFIQFLFVLIIIISYVCVWLCNKMIPPKMPLFFLNGGEDHWHRVT